MMLQVDSLLQRAWLCERDLTICMCVLATSSPSLYRINKFIFDKYV